MKCLYIFLCLIGLISCKIEGNLKGLFSNYKNTKSLSPNLIVSSDKTSYCDSTFLDSNLVVLINHSELLECIQRHDNSIVYIWKPNCHGNYCYSPKLIQQKCKEHKITLFLVAEYFDSEKMSFNYHIEKPILGIDTHYYKTNLTSKYLKRFILGLTNQENIHNDFLRFKNGEFIESFQFIDSI